MGSLGGLLVAIWRLMVYIRHANNSRFADPGARELILQGWIAPPGFVLGLCDALRFEHCEKGLEPLTSTLSRDQSPASDLHCRLASWVNFKSIRGAEKPKRLIAQKKIEQQLTS